MRKLNLILFLTFSISLFESTAQNSTANPTRRAIKKTELSSGIRKVFLDMTIGDPWEVAISVPKNYVQDSTNLILALHWGVFLPKTNNDFLECFIYQGVDTSKYIIVAPEANYQLWWKDPKEKQIRKLIELIRRYWPIKNIIVAGYSDGATGSVHFAAKHSDIIDGAIAMAGYYSYVSSYGVPTYIVHGVKDEMFSYSRSKSILDKIMTTDKDLEFITSQNLRHKQACAYIGHLQNAMVWMEEKLKIDH